MIIQSPKRLKFDGDAVRSEAVERIGSADRLSQSRRHLLRSSLTFGGLSMLTGYVLDDSAKVNAALAKNFACERQRTGLAVRPEPPGADLP